MRQRITLPGGFDVRQQERTATYRHGPARGLLPVRTPDLDVCCLEAVTGVVA